MKKPADANERDRVDHFFSMPGARADRWRALHAAAQAWAGAADRRPRSRLLRELGAYEEFFAIRAQPRFRRSASAIQSGEAEGTASLARRISEAILIRSYKHDAGVWESVEGMVEAPPELTTVNMAPAAHGRPYFEMCWSPRGRVTAARIRSRSSASSAAGGRLHLRSRARGELRRCNLRGGA